MSKPDPAGGSLEAILASIRKGLAEQSGEAAAEPERPSATPEPEAKPVRRGLTERLAGAAPGTPDIPQGSDDLSDLLEGPADPAPVSPASTAPSSQATSPATEDPLWFLSRREEQPQPSAGQSALGLDRGTGAASQPAAAEPSLTRPEVLRASMPPFFGSSESATVTPPPAEPAAQHATSASSASAAAAPPEAPSPAGSITREVSRVAGAETAAPTVSASGSGLNGAAATSSATDASIASGDAATNRALEAVVLELLKPMLRQWLDENMPRLVAQAISDEAARARLPDGAKKP